MLHFCLLASIIPDEKVSGNLYHSSYALMCLFLATFQIFFLSLIFKNLIMIWKIFILLRIYLVSWMCGFIVFIKFGNFSDIISSNIVLSLFLLGLWLQYVNHLLLPHTSLRLCFWWVLFVFSCSLCFILDHSLKFSAISYLLLIPSSAFLISDIVVFSSVQVTFV